MPANAPTSAADDVSPRAALQDLLDALAPLLLHARITPAMVCEAVRLSFVRAAADGARMASGRINHSRVATLTGLSRVEVRRLLTLRRTPRPPVPRQLDRAARVLEGWLRDPAFRTERGRPRMLPLRGAAPSFEALVQRYGGDVPPRAVQTELERAGAVRVTRGRIRLQRRRLALAKQAKCHPLPTIVPYLRGLLEALAVPAATVEWAHQLQIPIEDERTVRLEVERARRTLAAAAGALRPSLRTPPDRRSSVGITLIVTRPPPTRLAPARGPKEEP
jgi:hypothetical protein